MRFVRTAVVAATIGAFVVAPGVAQADSITRHSETHRDSTSDLLYWLDGRTTGPADARRAPNRLESDIQWITTTKGSYAVRLRVHFRDLRRAGTNPVKVMTFAVQRSDGTVINGQITVDSQRDPGNWAGAMSPTVPTGVTHRIDYDTNDVFVNIPNTILGSNAKVRSSFRIVTTYVTGYDPYWIDDARTGFVRSDSRTSGYGAYGPWIS